MHNLPIPLSSVQFKDWTDSPSALLLPKPETASANMQWKPTADKLTHSFYPWSLFCLFILQCFKLWICKGWITKSKGGRGGGGMDNAEKHTFTLMHCSSLSKQMMLPKRGVAPANSVSPTRSALKMQAVFVNLDFLCQVCKQHRRPWHPLSKSSTQLGTPWSPRCCADTLSVNLTLPTPLALVEGWPALLCPLLPARYCRTSPASGVNKSHKVSS